MKNGQSVICDYYMIDSSKHTLQLQWSKRWNGWL